MFYHSHFIADLRFVLQKGLMRDLRKALHSEVVTLVVDDIEDSEGVRTGTASVVVNDFHLRSIKHAEQCVIEGQSGSTVGSFNDFQFLFLVLENQCWQDLKNTALVSFRSSVKDAVKLKVIGTDVELYVRSHTHTHYGSRKAPSSHCASGIPTNHNTTMHSCC